MSMNRASIRYWQVSEDYKVESGSKSWPQTLRSLISRLVGDWRTVPHLPVIPFLRTWLESNTVKVTMNGHSLRLAIVGLHTFVWRPLCSHAGFLVPRPR